MGSKAFFTLEDLKAGFNLFCCMFGIGSLGMPTNYARAGPVFATIALVFTAVVNIYSSVVCSKIMLQAPRSVKTLGDLGEWSMGKFGRYIVVISQMGVCLLAPCAFLVLGGTLLNDLFPGAFSSSTWIILMAVIVLPVCLVPTLEEGAGAAFAGCMGTIIADGITLGVLLSGMSGHPSVPSPDVSFKEVVNTFGNLALAYGAAIVIPSLQRQHSEPTRMPRVIFVTTAFISVLFLIFGAVGYSAIGCQISGNLLFSIFPDVTTGITALGFTADQGMVVLAYLSMQLHITIAFNVIVYPVFYLLERLVLGMHRDQMFTEEAGSDTANFEVIGTPMEPIKNRDTNNRSVSMTDLEKQSFRNHNEEEEKKESSEYRGANMIKYALLRIAVVAFLTIASVLLEDHFLDLTDFVGASAITMCCIILPIVFYLKKLWSTIPLYEKVGAITAIIICFALGCYVTYTSGKNLFNPDPESPDDPTFPFCHEKYQNEMYYLKNNSTSS